MKAVIESEANNPSGREMDCFGTAPVIRRAFRDPLGLAMTAESLSATYPLPRSATCRRSPRRAPSPAVHHVDDDADMVRHDAHDVADIGPVVAAGEIEKAMLLGEARDPRLRIFEDQAVTVEAAAGIRRERLRARIENAAFRAGAADHRRVDVAARNPPERRDAGAPSACGR